MPFLAPALLLYGVFLIWPILRTFYLSFFAWSGLPTEKPEFVGLRNYVYEFTQDPVFYTALGNTLIWVVLSVLIPTALGLVLAMGLNRPLMGRNVMRSVLYIPAVLASIAVATMWTWIYNPTLGLANALLARVGLAHDWLGDPDTALYSVFIAFIWQSTGFAMVLFLAGLQSVPAELIEAAKIDGANAWQRFRAVTIPALRPTLAVVIVLTIISSLKVFDLIVGMTGGGPAQSTQVLALWSYSQSLYNHQFGPGSALSVILLAVTLILVVPYLVWTIKEDSK
ncbi:MAG: carbohydrate ABC transporter permease [Actinomycetales bacterium]